MKTISSKNIRTLVVSKPVGSWKNDENEKKKNYTQKRTPIAANIFNSSTVLASAPSGTTISSFFFFLHKKTVKTSPNAKHYGSACFAVVAIVGSRKSRRGGSKTNGFVRKKNRQFSKTS